MNMISPITPESGVETRIERYKRLPLWQRIGLVALPVALIGGAVELLDRPAPAMAAMPTPTVTVATPLARDIDQWDEYVGRFEPSRSVEVRPRVSGAGDRDPLHRRRDRPDRAICSSPSIRARSPPRWPRRARSPARRATSRSPMPISIARTGCRPMTRCRRRRRPADRQGPVPSRPRSPQPRRACAAARSTWNSPRCARRSPVASPIAGRCRQSRRGAAMPMATPADHDQRARPDLFQLRRLGGPVPQGQARAAAGGTRVAGRGPLAGRDGLSLAGPARLHRQRARPPVGHDPRPRGARQPGCCS